MWQKITPSLAVLLVALGGACGAPRKLDLTSDDPAAKIPAIKAAVRAQDRSAVAQLVKDLRSDDPAVRLYAIQGLARLTGETFDYRYYDEGDRREAAVQRWEKWLAEQHFDEAP